MRTDRVRAVHRTQLAVLLLGQRFGLAKLHTDTHLYTSSNILPDFPGRVFEVETLLKPRKKEVLAAIPGQKANLACRNYPETTEQLKKKLKVKDGGEVYLFAARTATAGYQILKCRKPG